ncbi:MAG: A24 family peptidase [Clostridia bacterium]|nr:A24 family peptidase [Clostridia bacterium]
MFINNIHIFWYVGLGILGLFVGLIIDLANKNLPEHKKFFSIQTIREYIKLSNKNYTLMIISSFLYIGLLRVIGMQDIPELVQFLVLTPMLISAFCIDYKMQIIPNRLTLTMLETGIIFSFIRGINNLNVAVEMWIGMLLGVAIFLILTYAGNIISKRETMGFGDVKLMGALGLFFGWRNIIAISILSFFIASIYSVYLIIRNKIKKQEINEVIPFGPFIVLAAFIVMFIPLDLWIRLIFFVFTFGRYKF